MNPLASPVPTTLIADDQPDVLAALRLLLKGAGFQTEAVSSPAAVLEAIERRKFDVVLMDLNYARDTTSGKEGLDLITRIQALDRLLPIVVMTAWGSIDLAVETMRRGVRDFVEKPWENSKLLQTLRTQIEQGRANRQLQNNDDETRIINRDLNLQLQEAREIQIGLMPKQMPQVSGFDLVSAWEPAQTVGGDYLAALKFDRRYAALCVADVSGKGLPAALLMSNMQAALKSIASPLIAPRDLCRSINDLMCINTPLHKFITCFYGVLDTETRRLSYCNAGHNAPFLMKASGECLRLEEGGPVLGAFCNSKYAGNEIQLSGGDRLLLFTDGLTEACNQDGEQFGEERLKKLLGRMRTLMAAEIQSKILGSVKKFCKNKFHDDAALMVVAVK